MQKNDNVFEDEIWKDIKGYPSIVIASMENNVTAGNIVMVCKGRYKQIKGYIYAYK